MLVLLSIYLKSVQYCAFHSHWNEVANHFSLDQIEKQQAQHIHQSDHGQKHNSVCLSPMHATLQRQLKQVSLQCQPLNIITGIFLNTVDKKV